MTADVSHSTLLMLTWLGDGSLLLPMAVAITFSLAWRRDSRCLCSIWLALLIITSTLVVATKLAFMGWGMGKNDNFAGFSGHATFAAFIWPVAFWLLVPHSRLQLRLAATTLGILIAIAVGNSRLSLNFHSLIEVVSGCSLGLAGSMTFVWASKTLNQTQSCRWLLAAGIFLPFFVFPIGQPMPTQRFLKNFAKELFKIEHPLTRWELERKSRQQAIKQNQ